MEPPLPRTDYHSQEERGAAETWGTVPLTSGRTFERETSHWVVSKKYSLVTCPLLLPLQGLWQELLGWTSSPLNWLGGAEGLFSGWKHAFVEPTGRVDLGALWTPLSPGGHLPWCWELYRTHIHTLTFRGQRSDLKILVGKPGVRDIHWQDE